MKNLLPAKAKVWLQAQEIRLNQALPFERLTPNFLIIGTQRGGTTSLYRYLAGHPRIFIPRKKEIQFFTNHYAKGWDWYLAHFPRQNPQLSGGDATPYYLFHPHAPRRAYQHLPKAKIIVLLRDPIERAFSHYRHVSKLGIETLPFNEAIAQEETRCAGELAKMLADETYNSYAYQHFTYQKRGEYAEQLQHWLEYYPREQMLILKSEDFFANPATVFNQVLEFLAVEQWEPKAYEVFNETKPQAMDSTLRRQLETHFAPHNTALCDEFGICF